MKKAEVRDKIKSKNGIVGIVEKVYENSVMVKIIENPNNIPFVNNVTVINHKNYSIL